MPLAQDQIAHQFYLPFGDKIALAVAVLPESWSNHAMQGQMNISEYCERLDPGTWAEPANFLSNAGFLLAAAWSYRQARRQGLDQDASVIWLVLWLAAIGLGSGLFHSLATPWSKICDVVPIAIFVASFYGLWLRQVLGFTRRLLAVAYLVLGMMTALSLAMFQAPIFAGSQGYFGVLILLPVLGAWQWRRCNSKPRLLYASIAFTFALACRTIDQPLCPWLPSGTHWLWHLLNAYVCLCALQSMLEDKRV